MVPNMINNTSVQQITTQQSIQPQVQQNQQANQVIEDKMEELTRQMENLKINMIRTRSNNRPNGYSRPQGNQTNRSIPQFRREYVCFNCNERGHTAKYCDKEPRPRQQNYAVNYFDEDYYDDDYYSLLTGF